MKIISGFSLVADKYDGFIIDLWGVLHDGIQPYPGAKEVLHSLKVSGKKIVLLSNAPCRAVIIQQVLERLGFSADLYDGLITSGEMAFQALRNPPDDWHARLGSRAWLLGRQEEWSILEGTTKELAISPDDADFVLAVGLNKQWGNLADHRLILARCLERRLPMLCANPDLVAKSNGTLFFCAGSLAQWYQEQGGDVRYHGKPYAPVYKECLDKLGMTYKNRILAIGDSFRTDIAGAAGFGLDSLLITGGIHLEEMGGAWGDHPEYNAVTRAAHAAGVTPTWAMGKFHG